MDMDVRAVQHGIGEHGVCGKGVKVAHGGAVEMYHHIVASLFAARMDEEERDRSRATESLLFKVDHARTAFRWRYVGFLHAHTY